VAGLFPLIALMLLSSVHAQLFGSPWRHMYYSGLCLFGWLLGLMASRVAERPTDESYALVGSIALLGAAYVNAGISKLAFGGFEWASGAPIQAVIVAQDGLVRDSLVSAYRSWVVMSPAVVGSFSLATMIFELAGPLMILDGPARVIVALGLLGMHLNIYVLTHILYWQSMVLLILLGTLRHEETPPSRAAALPILGSRGFVATAVTLAVAAVFAIGHQQQRYAAWRTGRNAPPVAVADSLPTPLPSPAEPTPTTPPSLVGPAPAPPPSLAESAPPRSSQQIGPFSVGDRVTDEWTIETLTPTDGAFTVMLVGPAGHARFEVNCADDEHRSPFDVGSAHIFYSRDVPFPVAQPVGNALRERVRSAAASRDPCQAVTAWMHSTR